MKKKSRQKFNRAVRALHSIYSSQMSLPEFHALMTQYGAGFVYSTVETYGRRWNGSAWVEGRRG